MNFLKPVKIIQLRRKKLIFLIIFQIQYQSSHLIKSNNKLRKHNLYSNKLFRLFRWDLWQYNKQRLNNKVSDWISKGIFLLRMNKRNKLRLNKCIMQTALLKKKLGLQK